jgi:hypothetical protein
MAPAQREWAESMLLCRDAREEATYLAGMDGLPLLEHVVHWSLLANGLAQVE